MKRRKYVAYFDLLGIGDSIDDDNELYENQLKKFRTELCTSVDLALNENDRIFAYSDSAFLYSESIDRMYNFFQNLQNGLWQNKIFLKGAISLGEAEFTDFAKMPGHNTKLVERRKLKLNGYWFGKDFVEPARIEKQLKGIAIQIDKSVKDTEWLKKYTCISCYYAADNSKKPIIIRCLKLDNNVLESLDDILRYYLFINNKSKRLGRYYISLIITYINSIDISRIEYKDNEFLNLNNNIYQLLYNRRIIKDVLQFYGIENIYYSILNRLNGEQANTEIINRVYEVINNNKKLYNAIENIPIELCSKEIKVSIAERKVESYYHEIVTS